MVPLESLGIRKLRRRYISQAAGDVLELGAGTGANIRWYNFSNITSLTLSDWEIGGPLVRRGKKAGAELVEADVENLPFKDASFDTVAFTLLFCSVSKPMQGLSEIRRVLKPGGKIIFLEHVLGCAGVTRRIQHLVTPLWRKMAGNCHLDRPTVSYIEEAGFSIQDSRLEGGCVLTAGVASLPAV